MELTLSNPQGIFLNSLKTKFRAYVGGFGSGKTFVGCLDLLKFMMENPLCVQGYFAPTYPQIRDIFYPTFEEAALLLGFRVVIKYSDKEIQVYKGQLYYGTIICRSMEKPNSIVGFKIARALVDEIDTLSKDKANQAWVKIIARMRLVVKGAINSIGVTTTPEGFLFIYEKFYKNPKESYSMVQASSYENEAYLPADYIPSLLETYDEDLANAYIRGQFVNLTSGSVYTSFDRETCNSNRVIKEKEPLHIGMDFNINNMAAVVFVNDGAERTTAADERIGLADTPAMIKELQTSFEGHHITVYPDASGKKGTTSGGASMSDLVLLKNAGFRVKTKESNPRVKDRTTCVNARFRDSTVKVNVEKCPESAECLEQQAYDKNGEPDKKAGFDHTNDAFGYRVFYSFKLKARVPRIRT